MIAKRWFLPILLLGIIIFSASGLAAEIAARNPTCPIMLNENTKDKFYADYEGKRIYFCCRSCVKKFRKNPTKYLENL